jgi:hypothetical protein
MGELVLLELKSILVSADKQSILWEFSLPLINSCIGIIACYKFLVWRADETSCLIYFNEAERIRQHMFEHLTTMTFYESKDRETLFQRVIVVVDHIKSVLYMCCETKAAVEEILQAHDDIGTFARAIVTFIINVSGKLLQFCYEQFVSGLDSTKQR